MLIQEWIYLFFVMVGFISTLLLLAYVWLVVDDRRLKSKQDFESRLLKGEILSKDNIF